MPTLHVDGFGSFEIEDGTRLVNALEDSGVDILHRCGGYARCTTCRVVFSSGEPAEATAAETARLGAAGLLGQVRLSCQIVCDHAMTVQPLNLLSASGLADAGPRPADEVTPPQSGSPSQTRNEHLTADRGGVIVEWV
jgi:ferredoxin